MVLFRAAHAPPGGRVHAPSRDWVHAPSPNEDGSEDQAFGKPAAVSRAVRLGM
jgi:hypothetical protein